MSEANGNTPRSSLASSRGNGSQPPFAGTPKSGASGGRGASSRPNQASAIDRNAPIPRAERRGPGFSPRADIGNSIVLQRLLATPRSGVVGGTPSSLAARAALLAGGISPGGQSGAEAGRSPSSLPPPSSRSGVSGTPGDGPSESRTSITGTASKPQTPGAGAGAGGDSHINDSIIWGTTINLKTTTDNIREFVRNFKPRTKKKKGSLSATDEALAALEEVSSTGLYIQLLQQALVSHDGTSNQSICIDAKHIRSFTSGGHAVGRDVYSQLIRYPAEVIPLFDIVLNDEYDELRQNAAAAAAAAGSSDGKRAEEELGVRSLLLRARIYNLESSEQRRMRDLNPADIDTLVSIRGMVIRTSPLMPDLRRAHFRCAHCGEGVDVDVERGRIDEPRTCPSRSCARKDGMQRVDNRGAYADKQVIKMQETPESVPEGETPHTVQLYTVENMCDTVVPGDRITVTGIYRAIPVRPNPRQRSNKAVFKSHLDVLHFASHEKGRLTQQAFMEGERAAPEEADGATQETDNARREREEACRKIALDPDLYANLAHSLAPSVWEMEDVKKGLLLMMLGGCNKDLGKEGKIRGEINVLMCGDPGAAKSQLLRYVHERAPRGIYTSGKGSSAVGLTASIIKDPDTREPVLESGALVLSDRGICCIDEFDKMSDMTRSILHEVMEQQTVSIAKAGVIATLNARTSILASANPVESRYNPKLSVVENIQLPPTLLSRFDLIYLILDHEQVDSDRRLAKHLVSLFKEESSRSSKNSAYSVEQLTNFVSYAKENVHPAITQEAAVALQAGYLDMRRGGMTGGKKTISATTRQLESLIRLSEAHARMRLSDQVTAEDVGEAVRLMNVSTHRAAVNPRTGTIDMEQLTTGRAAGEGDMHSNMVEALRELLEARALRSQYTPAQLLKDIASNTDVPVGMDDVVAALKELAGEETPLITFAKSTVTIVNAPY